MVMSTTIAGVSELCAKKQSFQRFTNSRRINKQQQDKKMPKLAYGKFFNFGKNFQIKSIISNF